MNKRDLLADLEIVESMNRCLEKDYVREEILPHALKRAIAAEEEVERLKKQLQASRDSVYGISCEADEARCERNELKVQVERLSKVIGSQKFEIDALDLEIEYLEEETKKVERLQALLQDSLKTMQWEYENLPDDMIEALESGDRLLIMDALELTLDEEEES